MLKTKIACLIMLTMFSAKVFALTLADLTNREWILIALDNHKIATTLYKDEKPNIKFADNMEFSAWAGCNHIHGSFTFTEPGAAKFAPNTIMTKMACSGLQNIEDPFVEMLPNVVSIIFKDDKLQFLDKDNAVIAEFITITTL